MRKIFVILVYVASFVFLGACVDDDSFSLSPSNTLTFATDTVSMDTVFSTVPTSTRSFWVYNKSGDGIRCTKVRLAAGNQTGFRVNVDGEYLSPASGYQVSDVEIRKKDSIRVFVELTSPENGKTGPQLLEDNLIFQLESGVEQRVNLKAYTWDAKLIKDLKVTEDMTLESVSKPVVVYGDITVDSFTTLRITAGSTVYFHADAGIDVYGQLITEGTAENNVVLRGDRMDNMFDYLPYDRVSGQWQGIKFNGSSYGNELNYTDIHSTFDGVVCDSSDLNRSKLLVNNSTIQTCQGYGLKSINSTVDVRNTLIANTLNNCVAVYGGNITLQHCTLAQFYPFDSNRGAALMYANSIDEKPLPLNRMDCINSIVTGYGVDQVSGVDIDDGETAFNYRFINSLLRTPDPTEENKDNEENFEDKLINVIFEDVDEPDSIAGEEHFRLVDIDKQQYDFHLNADSPAIDKAEPASSLPQDRDGTQRDNKPDIGCYEFVEEQKEP